MTSISKKSLGQFYTTNYEQILINMQIPKPSDNKVIIEPFAGAGDMLKFINTPDAYQIEKYDIDPQQQDIEQRDTLLNPPSYKGKFVFTNPPYLARNKSKDKSLYDKYDVNDLYKCFIKNLIDDPPDGGIIIIPLNFWCSIRKTDQVLRRDFLEKFAIDLVNIFEEKVFEDTTYTVCSIQFTKRTKTSMVNIKMIIYPSKKELSIILNSENDYIIGGEIYKLMQDVNVKVERLTKKNKTSEFITNINIKCIDDSEESKIGLSIVKDEDRLIDETPNLSGRSYGTLIIEPAISLERQHILVEKCNRYINEQREKYHSLFLTNYRESKSIARKRISFNLMYEIVNYVLQTVD